MSPTVISHNTLQEADLLSLNFIIEASSARSLDLLRAVDATLGWLCTQKDVFDKFLVFTRQYHETIKTLEADNTPLDPDGRAEASFNLALDLLDKYYNTLSSKRESARNDRRLTDEDGIADGYTSLMESVRNLHERLSDLAWCVGENDVDVELSGSHKISNRRTYKKNEIKQLLEDLKK